MVELYPGAPGDIMIISMAEQYTGPFCTLALSDMAADVIQVELPSGDPSRFLPSFYEALNRNKRSVALDARVPEQRMALLNSTLYKILHVQKISFVAIFSRACSNGNMIPPQSPPSRN